MSVLKEVEMVSDKEDERTCARGAALPVSSKKESSASPPANAK